MTEQEYINATDFDKVMCARTILEKIIPENSKVITKKEKVDLFKILNKWMYELSETLKISE